MMPIKAPQIIECFKPHYLWTLQELEDNALALLGDMDEGTYEEFEERMIKLAENAGIKKPVLAIGLKFKEGAHPFTSEHPCLVTRRTWPVFKNASGILEYTPKVFVIDQSLFALPS